MAPSRLLAAVTLVALLAGPPAEAAGGPRFRVLVFTKTAGFRHASIDDAVAAIDALAAEHALQVLHTEDAAQFTDDGLRGFDVVAFVLTTGDVLGPDQEAALQRYVQDGGGFVGVHSATDTEHGWPWYGDLVGASFLFHPLAQEATVRVTDREHPSTRFLPPRWRRTDEWYDFDRDPRRRVHVLTVVDERSYDGGSMGSDHPIAWCHRFQGGRSWYTALGHPDEAYADPLFRRHLLKGLEWAAGVAGGSCDPDTDPDVASIRYDSDPGAFSGGVYASPRRCETRRTVVILKVRPGADREVRTRRTDAEGDWRLRRASAAGRFRVVAPAGDGCPLLRSAPIRAG